MANVKVIKLLSGEEIITRIISKDEDKHIHLADDGHTILDRPRVIVAQPQQDGSLGIGLIPYVAVDPEGTFKIKNSAIVGEAEKVREDLEKGYLQQTSGLQLV